MIWFIRVSSPSRGVCLFIRSLNRNHRDEKEKADNDDEAVLRESRIWGRVLNLFCASVLELCSTEVESFVLISLCSLAKRGIEFLLVVTFVIHLFLLETVVSVCREEESSTDQSEFSFKPTV